MVHKGYFVMKPRYKETAEFFRRDMWHWQAGDPRLTQKEYAEYLGVEPVTLNKWINGERVPDYDSCEQLAPKLGYRIFIVCGYIPPDPTLKKLISTWDELTEYARDEIETVVRNRESKSRPVSMPSKGERSTGSEIEELDSSLE